MSVIPRLPSVSTLVKVACLVVVAVVASFSALWLAAAAAVITVAVDSTTARQVEVEVLDVGWRRTVHYEVREARHVRVSCADRTHPLAARIPSPRRSSRHRRSRSRSRSRDCYATLERWWPEAVHRDGRGRDRHWPPFEAQNCRHQGCTRSVGRDEELTLVLPSMLLSRSCPVDEHTWAHTKPGDRVKVRRTRLLGWTRCDGLALDEQ